MLIVCTVIFIAVFGVMFYSIFKHRKSKGARAANFHESTMVEIAWTVVPFVIVIGMALPATKTRRRDEGHERGRPHDQGHRHPVEVGLRLPQRRGRGHRLRVDARPDPARDVRHRQARGRRLPAEGRQPARRAGRPQGAHHHHRQRRDPRLLACRRSASSRTALPGFVRDTWFRAEKVGDYYGQCFELCGKEHAYMPIHVKVLSQADYTRLGRAARRRKRRPRPTTRTRSGSWPALQRARRADLHRQLPGLPPGQRQGRRQHQGARRLADGARRRQDQADPRRC